MPIIPLFSAVPAKLVTATARHVIATFIFLNHIVARFRSTNLGVGVLLPLGQAVIVGGGHFELTGILFTRNPLVICHPFGPDVPTILTR
jgi:hypothetical protein